MRKKMKTVMQLKSNECAICCISMIAAYYGFKRPIGYYRKILDSGRDGLSIQDIITIFDTIKIDSEVKTIEAEEIPGFHIPLICYIENSHFVVVEKKNNEYLYLYDPAIGKRTVSIQYFKKIFMGILIIPRIRKDFAESIEKEIVWGNYFKIINPTIVNFIFLFGISIFSYIIMLFIPVTVQNIIDKSNEILNVENLVKIVPLVTFLFFFVSGFRNKIIILFEKKADIMLTNAVIKKLLNVNFKFFEDRDDGDLLFRLNLLSIFRTTISNSFINLFLDFSSSMIILIALFLYNFFVGAIVFLLIVLLGTYVKLINNKLISMNQEELYSQSKVYSIEAELIKCIYSIKAMGIEADIYNEFNHLHKEYMELFSKREGLAKNNITLLSGIRMFFPVLLLVFCAYLSNIFKLTLGEQLAIYTLSGMLISSTISFFQNTTSIFMVKNMLMRINDILNEKDSSEGGIELKQVENIKLENVSYSYNQNKQNSFALSNINMDIKKGSTVAFVGQSGSGKSTLIKLILGLYAPSQGIIRINGENILDINKNSLKNRIGVVPQEVVLFSRSIRDNIALSNSEVTFKDIQYAAKIAGIHDEIQKFPMKYETILSEGGGLSGGQKQRIALARAIIKKPDFIILDEATNSLDNVNEKLINDNIKSINCTKLIVAHRFSTIIEADYIYVLKEGNIVGEGTHQELINSSKYYRELFGGQLN